MALRIQEESVQRSASKRSISLSFIERCLSRLTITRRDSESSEDIKGPLGLNLLHEPSEPRIDLIFVHGLGGGSRKTWSNSEDSAQFWPKEWLPSEPGFKHVRIHSYGYDSDWGERKENVLNIHDFGQALLADIYNSPQIRKNGETPIILVGHSMGGLVIKKVYLLATRDPNHQQTAKRIHSMFFLASPHRGANSAKLLNNLLRVSVTHGPKAYVSDLVTNSGTLQVINEEFRHIYHSVQLWSFFETIKTNLGYSQELVVEKDSAILGLPGEHIQYLNADHRNICKFKSPSDSNYVILHNAFASVIDGIEKHRSFSKYNEHRAQMKLVAEYIGVSQRPETDLIAANDKIIDGSCLWLIDRPGFHDWFEGSTNLDPLDPLTVSEEQYVPKFFWLSGKPGTGKSTAAAYVVKYLEECNCDCSFHFFKYSENVGSNIAGALRSLVYQMSYLNFEIRQIILTMVRENEHFNKDDHNTIWRIFFLTRIFRAQFQRPHYWVLDALDECNGHATLLQLFSKIDENIPLRVFITSRPLPSIQRLFIQEKIPVTAEQVRVEDSLKDIELFLYANIHSLPVEDDLACRDLIAQIVQKSNGCFLWVAVALRQLEAIYSVEQINDVMRNVPAEMDELYTRILQGIVAVPSNVEFAKSILRWTVCAIRPLKIDELKEALHLDIGHMVPRLESVVGSMCGHLVYVDNDSSVQLVHQTVRTFLTRQDLVSELAINKRKESSRLAEICLTYLSGKELQTPRVRRGNAVVQAAKLSMLADYASQNFAEHLANSSSAIDAPLLLLDSFLKNNVLAWIELIAKTGEISHLIQTAKNLRSYLDRRAKYRSPLGAEVQEVNAWANDFIRLGAAFGRNLLAHPKSIHFLIPPLCPPRSAIYRSFANYPRCLRVVGLSDEGWDDRLACINYSDQQALSIACRDGFFAVGLSNSKIMLYRTTTFEDAKCLDHGEPVRHLAFATLNLILASSGSRKVRLWNTRTGNLLWNIDIRGHLQPMALSFGRGDLVLMLATKENHVAIYQVADGLKLDSFLFHEIFENEVDDEEYRRPPWNAQFSSELNLLAISYRNRPVIIWDLETFTCLGQFQKSGSEDVYPAPQVNCIAFNPNPQMSLVAAAYNDGDLITFDPWNLVQIAAFEITVQVLVASPDGRILATGDVHGNIHLFNFETLRLVYRSTAHDYDVRAMVFTSDSQRFFDIRGDQCNIWEPSDLVRRDNSDDSTSEPYSEEIQPSALLMDTKLWNNDRTITAIADHHGGELVFCGRGDGTIALYEVRGGTMVQELCRHANMVSITLLCWNAQSSILTSVDTSSRFMARRLAQTAANVWLAEVPILDKRASQAIVQVLGSPSGKQLLISTALSDDVWSLEGNHIGTNQAAQMVTRIWITHPLSLEQLLLVEDNKIHIFKWSRFEKLSKAEGASLFTGVNIECLLKDMVLSPQAQNICIRLIKPSESGKTSILVVLKGSHIQSNVEEVRSIVGYESFEDDIKVVIGTYKSLLVFLDSSGWVCSINIGSVRKERSYTKHFFIPFTWHSYGELLFRITTKGSVVLARRDEIVVFHKGIEFEEKVVFEVQETLPMTSHASQRRQSAYV